MRTMFEGRMVGGLPVTQLREWPLICIRYNANNDDDMRRTLLFRMIMIYAQRLLP
jgi:hypothetical protein